MADDGIYIYDDGGDGSSTGGPGWGGDSGGSSAPAAPAPAPSSGGGGGGGGNTYTSVGSGGFTAPSVSGSGAGGDNLQIPVFQTVNGQKTAAQMYQELQRAGVDTSKGSLVTLYQQTFGGPQPQQTGIQYGYAGGTAGGITPPAGGGGGAPTTPQQTPLENALQMLLGSLASGNKAAFDEGVRQFNANLAEQQRQFDTKTNLDILNTAAQLRGPRNAFQQQAYLNGLNSLGYSNAIDAIAGRVQLPKFQAPQAMAQPASLQSLSADLKAAGGSPTDQTLAALPNPNQIDPVAWNKLDPDTQDYLRSAYEAKGISANTIDSAVRNALPGFKAPAYGLGVNV